MRRNHMRIKLITHITSFSTTAEMFNAIKNVSHELRISASDLIREAIEDYLRNRSFNSDAGKEGKECSDKNKPTNPGEVSKNDNVRTL